MNQTRTNLVRCAALAALLGACTGGGSNEEQEEPSDDGSEDDGDTVTPSGDVDPGWKGIHRLNNSEYNNTIADLLGVKARPADAFAPDEQALGFDNIASALGMTPSQYEQYFNAANALADEVWKDNDLRGRIVKCAGDDEACTRTVIADFGLRAWRRPLGDDEIDGLVKLYGEAKTAGEDHLGSLRHVVAVMLASPPFLYRIEKDGDEARRLDGYELASRLSYLVWSTMPDEDLFAAAADGNLNTADELERQLNRLLDDPRGQRYIDAFAAQWLGMRSLKSHQVDKAAFPDWDEPLRAAMVQEASRYFAMFLTGEGRTARDFFTARLNFVNRRLASHYGLPAASFGDDFKTVEDALPERRGFLGLGSFLTERSFLHRTSPTARGVWIVTNLLCEELPSPPAMVPELEDAQPPASVASDNVRERLAAHRENPGCAACHAAFDPIGLGLENFDGIGKYRKAYASGDEIDASGQLPEGESFNGLLELTEILSKDNRFAACMSRKMFTHALGRAVEDTDQASLDQIQAQWEKDDLNVRALLRHLVLSESFRSRRPEL